MNKMAWPTVWSVLYMIAVTQMHLTPIIDGAPSAAPANSGVQLKTQCELRNKTVEGGSLEPVFESEFKTSLLGPDDDWKEIFVVDVGTFVRIRCRLGFRIDGDDIAQCGTDGSIKPTLRCKDIDECTIISDEVQEITEYSLTYDDGAAEEPNEAMPEYPMGYPCLAPFHCRNRDGTFQCVSQDGQSRSDFTQCIDVDVPDFGKIIEQSQVHVKFTCNIGCRLVGSSQRFCVSGEWDGEQPTCEALLCEAPNEIINNGWSTVSEDVTYEYGNEIRYGCNDSYRLVGGNERRVCTASSHSSDAAHWSGRSPSCQVIQCPQLDSLANGDALVTSRYVGGKVTFRCHYGYELRGAPVRECRSNGRWSGAIATCNDPDTFCPTPEVPSCGRIEGSSNYDRGDVITYYCNHGYDLIGLPQRNCTSNRQWSGKVPMCLGKGEYNDDDMVRFAEQLRQTAAEYKSTNLPEDLGDRGRTGSGLPLPTNWGLEKYIENFEYLGDRGRTGSGLPLPTTGPGTDIIFLFDVSKSVRTKDSSLFQETVTFAKEFVSKVGVSRYPNSGVKYAIVPYASRTTTLLQLKDARTKDDVFKALDQIIVGAEELGDGTSTSLALQMVHQNVIPISVMHSDWGRDGRSPETKKTIFLLTDGKSNMNGLPEIEAAKLKNDFEVSITCIGIGDEADRGELNRIASEDSQGNKNVHILKRDGLRDLLELLLMTEQDYSVCGESEGLKESETSTDDMKVWPWQAGIYTTSSTADLESIKVALPSFFCGGTLIAPNWILSAAHCFDENEDPNKDNNKLRHKPEHLLVVMGTTYRVRKGFGENGIERRVNRTIIHPYYNTSILPKYDFDIALLELAEPFVLGPYIRTVCRPNRSNWTEYYEHDENTFMTGWGRPDQDSTLKFSNTLKQLRLPIQDEGTCKIREHKLNGNLTDRMFCAGKGDGIDACQGDSGGPLVRAMQNRNINGILGKQWFQVGIVSWGIGCGNPNHYGYYTHISRLNEWIDDVIGAEDLA